MLCLAPFTPSSSGSRLRSSARKHGAPPCLDSPLSVPSCLPMDTKAISESLRLLATGHENRSKAARLRDVLPDVETAAAAGVKRAEIVKVLAANGLDISEKSLGVMLSRIRKKHKIQSGSASHVFSQTSPALKAASPSDESTISPSALSADNTTHDPATLKAVMRTKPSIDHYARIHRESKGKE